MRSFRRLPRAFKLELEPVPPARFLFEVLRPLCERCGQRPARVSVTRTSFGGQKRTESVCATCAGADEILGSMLTQGLANAFLHMEDSADLDEHIVGAPFEALMDVCFSNDEFMGDDEFDAEWPGGEDPFPDDPLYSLSDDEGDPFDDDRTDRAGVGGAGTPEANLFQTIEAHGEERGAICPGCSATWEQIALDERAGCPKCYSTFRVSLTILLEQVQRESQHIGKKPRAAHKRRLRLEHLRQRRDNQLAMLNNRLAEAIKSERYEEAATLRDKIKIVSSSLF